MAAVDLTPQTIQALADAVSGSSGSFSSSGTQDTTVAGSEAERQQRANNIRYAAATKDLKTASKAFKDISNQQDKTADQIKKQVDLNSHFVSSAIEGMSKLDISASAFNGLEDLLRSEEQLKIAHQMKVALENLKDGTVFDPTQYQELSERMDDAGTSFEEMGVSVRTSIRDGQVHAVVVGGLQAAEEGLSEETNKLSKQVKKDTDAINRHSKAVENSKALLKGAGAAVLVAGKMIIDETRMAMRTATGDAQSLAGVTTAVKSLRITTSEYQEILAKTRNIQHAVNQSGANFTSELVASAQALTHSNFAGSAKEAADAAAGFMTNVTSMGVRFDELQNPMERQKDLYDKHFRGMSMSLDQFNQMTEDLLADTDVRNDIARLDKRQRQAYIEQLQITTAENIERGYSIERAKELNKHFAKISGMNPLDRLKKAAQERAMMGTLGMAEQGAELQSILQRLPGMQGPEKAAAQERAAEIRAQAANELKRRRGLGGGAEITYGMLADKLGYNEIANTFQTDAVAGRKFDKELANKQAKELFEVNETLSRGVWLADQAKAGLMSGETALLFMAGSWIFTKGMEKAMGGVNNKLSAIAGATAAGGVSGIAGKMGKGMFGTGSVGLARVAMGSAAALSLIPYAVDNLASLIESGGATSPVYESLTDLLGGQSLGSMIYGWLNDDAAERESKAAISKEEAVAFEAERFNMDKRKIQLQEEGLSAQKALVQAAKEANEHAIEGTKEREKARKAATAKQNSDSMAVAN